MFHTHGLQKRQKGTANDKIWSFPNPFRLVMWSQMHKSTVTRNVSQRFAERLCYIAKVESDMPALKKCETSGIHLC